MSRMSEIVGLHKFVCHRPIISFDDFVKSKDESDFVVVACYLGIDEGVDKWIDNQLSSFVPRLRVSVGDFDAEAPFLLRDHIVERFALRTCKMLIDMSEASSLYPTEMDSLFADPMIFEVAKHLTDSSGGAASYVVANLRITFWMPLMLVHMTILLLILKRFLERMNLIMMVVWTIRLPILTLKLVPRPGLMSVTKRRYLMSWIRLMKSVWIFVRGCQGQEMCNVVRFVFETFGFIFVYVVGSWAACIPYFVFFFYHPLVVSFNL
ncbi:hypothetical protein MtrunA17_Chr6g0469741 [Medicago truncatula]|uniref:Transmembrane protein n=1 Tax=Medicago truncatula TaxID=3880 RepID=A0A396HKX4_MEDTR|nr:hypothetical protein MtrunA17_Chr6g0469741 [Medicago truncatula]